MAFRILIVDDSSPMRNLLRNCLESVPGCKVCGEAVNGKEAVEKAPEMRPNLIVIDLSMPVMNGLQAAKVLNKLMPAVPMVMYTSFVTQNLEQEALAAGVCQVIAKESMATLIGAVRSFAAKNAA